MTVRFTAHTRHPWAARGWINVTVHDTLDDLRAAARQRTGEDFSNAGACFHPFPYYEHVNADGTSTPAPGQWYAGHMRLTADSDAGIVTHECTHAAVSVYRLAHALTCDLGAGCGDDEETFAYVLGDLVTDITTQMYAHGLWGVTPPASS